MADRLVEFEAQSWDFWPAHSGLLARLHRRLTTSSGFRLFVLAFNDPAYRDKVIRNVEQFSVATATLKLGADFTDFAAFEEALERTCRGRQAVHLVDFENWRSAGDGDGSAFSGFNYHRELIAQRCPVSILLWLLEHDVKRFALEAPDMWAWRSDVMDFAVPRESGDRSGHAEQRPSIAADREQRITRIRELDDLLRTDPPNSPGLTGTLLIELGEHHEALGDLDRAADRLTEAAGKFRENDDVRGAAQAEGLLARIWFRRGRLDDALNRFRRCAADFERIGDTRSRAVAMGDIADILYRRGELDEALRIRREEQLPVYERLGDVRSRAVAMGDIADILEQRGELDEALRIRREEQLPVYERLGDVRSRAVTMGKIADILEQRGELDEALRIRREEELPVYERLGDVRSRAVTMGQIADILYRRGELDEALRIRREEELPVYERLGDVRSRAVTMGKIGDILEQRGELDEALRIRREEELPVYERLGDVRSRAVASAKVARCLIKRGAPHDREEAGRLLRRAFDDMRRLRIPEAGRIEAMIAELEQRVDTGDVPPD